MPGITVTDTYNSLLTTTLRNFRKQLINNVFEPTHFLKWLMKKRGNGKEFATFDLEDGGYELVEHITYGKNTTVKFYEGYETLDTTPQEGHTIAKFPWREAAGTITISRREERQNSGESRLINLLKAKTEQTQMSLKDKISELIFANITSSPSRNIDGILLYANDSPSTTTAGAISGADNTWWRNYEQNVGAFGANLEKEMRTAFNTVSKWSAPDFIVATQGAEEFYEALAGTDDNTLRRFVDDTKSLDLGFTVFRYKGADLFFDYDFQTDTPVTGDSMIMGNSKFIRFVMDSKTNFITTDFIEPENQTARTAKVLFMGNLTINNRASLALLHGIDPS